MWARLGQINAKHQLQEVWVALEQRFLGKLTLSVANLNWGLPLAHLFA